MPEQAKREAIVEATLQTRPQGMTHWSCRTMARAQGVSQNTVHRLGQRHNRKPHLPRTFKLSRAPSLLEQLTDVVGWYLNPPHQAVVLCVGEQSQIQALDRTQPGLPLQQGRCGTTTHDHVRHGTTPLFAALHVLAGKGIGQWQARQRPQAWLQFPRRLDSEFPAGLPLHLVLDNEGTRKEPHVVAGLKRPPRFVCHFLPTSSSWWNLGERWFEEWSEQAIRRGAFGSVPALIQASEAFLAAWNEAPRPFIWTATGENLVAKIGRARTKLEQLKPGCPQPRQRKSQRQ